MIPRLRLPREPEPRPAVYLPRTIEEFGAWRVGPPIPLTLAMHVEIGGD
jgi:hypothetical protein